MASRIVRSVAFCFAIAGLVLTGQTTYGQDDIQAANGGVEIDASGVLTARGLVGGNPALNRQRAAAARAALNNDLQKPSKLRKVSLTKLEAEIKKLIDAGEPIPEDMSYLAGLTRITHVFYYPETKEIVIAGPAQGFFRSVDNRIIGIEDGRATLQLQDLVVALRAFGPDGRPTGLISCSIDPTQDGLKNMKQAYSQVLSSGVQPRGNEARIAKHFQNALGMQTITVKGISPKTRFAQVMVEADYRMKLIGIGLERPPVRITSFIEKASPTAVAKNSLQRWYFQPEYSCVHISRDQNSMELVGDGVKLVGEDESIANDGSRNQTGKSNKASRTFCDSFTKMYAALAEKATLFAELRNCIDMSIAAAFIQQMDLYSAANWELEVFADESKFPVEIFNAPQHVAPAVNAVWKGQYFMTPIGGGVTIQPRVALKSDNVTIDDDGKINKIKDEAKAVELAEGRWWWD